jgi:hypothetical protein
MKRLIPDLERAAAIPHDSLRRCEAHNMVDCINCFRKPFEPSCEGIKILAERHKHPTYSRLKDSSVEVAATKKVSRKQAPIKVVVKPKTDDESISPSILPSSRHTNKTELLKPEPLCPHNGISIGGVLICEKCLRDTIKDPVQLADEKGRLFGNAILSVCKKSAFRHRVISESIDDCTIVAVLEILKSKNQKAILKARDPGAMVYTIACRAIKKLYRRGRSVVALSVGQMNFGSEKSNDKDFSVTSRLDYLDGKMRFGVDQDSGWTSDSSTGACVEGWVADNSAFAGRSQDEWAQLCYERARTIPGIGLLWNKENWTRLHVALDEAKKLLPIKPFSVWLVIDMRIGFSQGMKQQTWAAIAEQVSPSWKRVTERQVRYAYDQGLATMKAHLLSMLMPVRERATP